jgi:hypothetical protein
MASHRKPGVLGVAPGELLISDGTLCLSLSPLPGPICFSKEGIIERDYVAKEGIAERDYAAKEGITERDCPVKDRFGKPVDPVTFYQNQEIFKNEWWTATIASYKQCRMALKNQGLHSHHLIPQSLLKNGPLKYRGLIDYIPCIPFTEAEHLKTLHKALNKLLDDEGWWKQPLTKSQLDRAIRIIAEFYDRHGLRHCGAAIRGFQKEAYEKI